MTWERTAIVDPGYDRRDEAGLGADGMHIRLVLIDREEGRAITVRFDLGLMHRPLQGAYYGDGRQHERDDRPGLDQIPGVWRRGPLYPHMGPVVWHARPSDFEADSSLAFEQDCDVLGGRCISDVGYTAGEDALEHAFASQDAIWEWMEQAWADRMRPPS